MTTLIRRALAWVHAKNDPPPGSTWTCDSCGAINPESVVTCWKCGA